MGGQWTWYKCLRIIIGRALIETSLTFVDYYLIQSIASGIPNTETIRCALIIIFINTKYNVLIQYVCERAIGLLNSYTILNRLEKSACQLEWSDYFFSKSFQIQSSKCRSSKTKTSVIYDQHWALVRLCDDARTTKTIYFRLDFR